MGQLFIWPSIVYPLTPVSCDAISVLSAGISMKLGTNIYRVSGHCSKGFQAERSVNNRVTVRQQEAQLLQRE